MGNRFCSVNAVIRAYHQGNKQSMIRWIRKGEGRFEYDFTIFDRYLDLYAAKIGKPRVLLLPVFVPGSDRERALKRNKGKNPVKLSLLDPATGKVEPMEQPLYGTPESVAFWKPVLGEALKRLEKRGWLDVTAIGAGSDSPPGKATVGAFKQVWPECVWMNSSHTNPSRYVAEFNGKKSSVRVRWREHVWSAGRLYDPDRVARGRKAVYRTARTGAERGGTWAFLRVGQGLCGALHEGSPLVLHRAITEAAIQGGETGVGRIGADYWPLFKGKYGAAVGLSGHRGMHLSVGASTRVFVAPGPDGPVATEQLEAFAEGAQLREAIIILQRAAKSGKGDADWAPRLNDLLNGRARDYIRTRRLRGLAIWTAYRGRGLVDRDARLYALAEEVAKKRAKVQTAAAK
jgi:hypothetical protein